MEVIHCKHALPGMLTASGTLSLPALVLTITLVCLQSDPLATDAQCQWLT